MQKFDLPLLALQNEEGLKGAGYDLIRSVSKENVKYIEVRFAPLLSVHEIWDKTGDRERSAGTGAGGKKEFRK